MVWLNAAINSQQEDGWFGPGHERGGATTRLKGRADLWPNMIMLFNLQNYYEYSGDKRVIKLMKDYFKYLQTYPEDYGRLCLPLLKLTEQLIIKP